MVPITVGEHRVRACGGAKAASFTLHEVIGSGGTAVVYRATRNDGTPSALKVIHPHLASDERWVRRFRKEAALLRSLSHAGLLRVLDVGTLAGGSSFVAFELLDGCSLEVLRHERGGRLDLADVFAHSRRVLDVLSYTHARGVVHRDLKPSNVFLTTNGELKLLDFGIAADSACAETGSAAAPLGILGTPAFMPPEQARGRWDLVDERSDLWAVGAMIFALASGEFVHVAGNENERLGLAMSRPARSLARAWKDADPRLVRVLKRALAYERSARYQDAREFRAALEGIAPAGGVLDRAAAAWTSSVCEGERTEERSWNAMHQATLFRLDDVSGRVIDAAERDRTQR